MVDSVDIIDVVDIVDMVDIIVIYVQGGPKKTGISKSMYIALRAIKIKQIEF